MPDSITRDSPIPLYRQLTQVIGRRIEDGTLKPGAMTSEQELATEFGVSRMTIRQALDHLVREGRMLRVQGKGTFVAEGRKLEPLSALTSFSENMRALGREPSYRILGVDEVPAPPEVAAHLALEPNALALRIVRLLIADEVPMALMRGYLPPWIYTAQPALFSPERLDQVSLYRTLEVELGIQLWKARETVEALTAGDDAERLELNPDDLLLVVHRHTLDIEARPVEYTQLRYRADLYRYQVELFRQGFAAPAASRFA